MKLILLKISSLIALAGFIFFVLYAQEPKRVEKSVLEDTVAAAADDGECEKATSKDLKRLYGLNEADYDYAILYQPVSNMDVTEVLIISLKDEAQKETVKEAAETRLETQKKNFDGYGTDQVETLKSAVIYAEGCYVCYFAGESAKDTFSAFKKTVEVR